MAGQERSKPSLELNPGELFAERYLIEALLGRGGMGAVYRAADMALGEPVALKILPVEADFAPQAALRFRQEVKLARRVTHPNVARVFDIGEHRGLLFLTMELVEGANLHALLQSERRLPAPRAAALARAVALGLEAAHAAGVIHRDLKPANVLLDRSGRVVLSDFGVARLLTEESFLTTGGVVGTPFYMAPEQAAGGAIDARTDLYALGLLLYEMLTGERSQGSVSERAARLAAAAVPAELLALVQRCLEIKPERRPASATEVARRLEAFADGETTAPDPSVQRGAETLEERTPAGTPTHTGPSLRPAATGAPAGDLAVLPFTYHGSSDHAYLGDTIADELVDVLARTRGLRVIGTAATARFREGRDPRAICEALGAYALIDGTVQRSGDRVRISVRATSGATRVQIWSMHYEGDLGDLFAFQESVARRIAEGLRVEIGTIAYSKGAPAAAVEHYLAGRRSLRVRSGPSFELAVASFARCLEIAPDFAPAVAGHAMSCLRCWMSHHSPRWAKEAQDSVARTLERAPELAESNVVAGLFASYLGEYGRGIRAFVKALDIAPTCPEALGFLGMLESEAGYGEVAVRRLELAHQLDPTMLYPLYALSRHHELRGDTPRTDAVLAELQRPPNAAIPAANISCARIMVWRGDDAALLRWGGDEAPPAATLEQLALWFYARGTLGKLPGASIEERLAGQMQASSSRHGAYMHQLMAEVYARHGDEADALRHLTAAAASIIDIEWLDLCPIFARLRDRPAFREARRQVRARVEALMNT